MSACWAVLSIDGFVLCKKALTLNSVDDQSPQYKVMIK